MSRSVINEGYEGQVGVETLVPHPRNPRQGEVEAIAESIAVNGFYGAVVAQRSTHYILAGNHRWMAARAEGLATIPVIWVDVDDEAALRILLADNRYSDRATYDVVGLTDLLEQLAQEERKLQGTGYSDEDLATLLATLGMEGQAQLDGQEGDGAGQQPHTPLTAQFVVPPFSVLDARQGYWRERKRQWLSLGLQSEVGRGAVQSTLASARKAQTGNATVETWVSTSIFDPVLCELVYRWFCPPTGSVLDPFAGGSVRGVVAAKLGRPYVGIELRGEQVAANEAQADAILGAPTPTTAAARKHSTGNGTGARRGRSTGSESDTGAHAPLPSVSVTTVTTTPPRPQWVVGDSRGLATLLPAGQQADLIFTCPPYYDLEVYSDDPGDLSALGTYAEFLVAYRAIIDAAIAHLRPNRFACVVVGDVRDSKTGLYRNFVADTIAAFQDAGAALYNEAILVTAIGSLPVRIGHQFSASRKLGKTHQNLLTFVKGDPRAAVDACGPIEVGDITAEWVERGDDEASAGDGGVRELTDVVRPR